jgi:hypothetical protein
MVAITLDDVRSSRPIKRTVDHNAVHGQASAGPVVRGVVPRGRSGERQGIGV